MLAKFKATFQDLFEHFEDGGISVDAISNNNENEDIKPGSH